MMRFWLGWVGNTQEGTDVLVFPLVVVVEDVENVCVLGQGFYQQQFIQILNGLQVLLTLGTDVVRGEGTAQEMALRAEPTLILTDRLEDELSNLTGH